MHIQDFMPVLQVTLPLIITMVIGILIQRSDLKDFKKKQIRISKRLELN